MRDMVKLQVFISDDCWSCAESRRIVTEIAPQFPDVEVELLDMNSSKRPETVFAAPTYLLNGRVISLGNPYPGVLRRQLSVALAQANA